MNFYPPKATYVPQKPGWQGIWEKVETGARTCYKSEGKTEYDEDGNSLTACDFANKILNVYKHRSVAEHAAIYLMFAEDRFNHTIERIWKVFETQDGVKEFSKVNHVISYDEEYICVSTNLRVILDNDLLEQMKPYMVEPTEYHTKRYSIRVFTDRGVSAELNRHRVNSPSERSTRYVDQSHELAITTPHDYEEGVSVTTSYWFDGYNDPLKQMCNGIVEECDAEWDKYDWWLFANLACQRAYFEMRDKGCEKQEARRILPLDIQTELFISAYEDDWKHFFDLRLKGTTGTPHPDMKHLAGLMRDELIGVMPWLREY